MFICNPPPADLSPLMARAGYGSGAILASPLMEC